MTPQTDIHRVRQTTSGSLYGHAARLRALLLMSLITAGALLLIADQCAAEFVVTAAANVYWTEIIDGRTETKSDSGGGSGLGAFGTGASGNGGSARSGGNGSGGSDGRGSMFADAQSVPNGPKIVGSNASGYVRVDAQVPGPVNVMYGIVGANGGYSIYRDGAMTAFPSVGSFIADSSFLISIAAQSQGGGSATATASFAYAPVGQVLPGKIKTESLKPDPPNTPYPDDNDAGFPPSEVAGAFSVGDVGIQASPAAHVHAKFNTPVVDDYGRDSPLFFDPTYYGSQLYTVADNLITSLLIPDPLPGGDSEFSVRFGDEGQFNLAVHAGEIFDFRTYVAGGIPWFVLAGLDLPNGPSAASVPPFVTGLTFAENGVQRLRVWTTNDPTASPVPEPATLTMSCIAFAMYGALRIRRRRHESATK